jgi:hypothetical protein
MESLNVVLEGHVVNYDYSEDSKKQEVYKLYPNEILALEEIPDIRLSMNKNIEIEPIILK